jgi:hypothetical protein
MLTRKRLSSRAARSTENEVRGTRDPCRSSKRDSEVGVGLRRRRGEDLCGACLGVILKKFCSRERRKIYVQSTKCCALGASYLVRQRRTGTGRVDDWRGGDRSGISVAEIFLQDLARKT